MDIRAIERSPSESGTQSVSLVQSPEWLRRVNQLENKLLELEGKQAEDREFLTGCLVVTALIAVSAILGGILSAYEQQQRLERLEHTQGIDAIGRRIK
jgi:hypothetical protein